jgi:2-oxoglutarate dehydrogenase E2 component (dihydrolipoamide succinyltransferase)
MELRLAELVPGMEYATVLGCRKQLGERVETGEILFEFEAEKVSCEVESPTAGLIAELLVVSGDEVSVGSLLAVISDG